MAHRTGLLRRSGWGGSIDILRPQQLPDPLLHLIISEDFRGLLEVLDGIQGSTTFDYRDSDRIHPGVKDVGAMCRRVHPLSFDGLRARAHRDVLRDGLKVRARRSSARHE